MADETEVTRIQLENEGENRSRETTETPTLESLLTNLGACGRFQVVFVTFGYFSLLPAGWALMFMTFGNYDPGWKCHDEFIFNETEFLKYTVNTTASTLQNERNVSLVNTSISACDTLKSCKNLVFNDIAETVVTEWTLICDQAWIPSLIISIQMAGVTLGSYGGGQIGDRLGRKFNVHGGVAVLTLLSIAAIFSSSWTMYAVMRFLIGFASGCILSTSAVYCCEFIPAWWRGFLGTFPYWNVATFSFALCVMAVKNWKLVHIASAIVSFLAFLPVFWLPESMRFLTVHGKLRKANKVVKKIARLNRKPLPDTTVMNKVAQAEKENMKNRPSYNYFNLFHRNIRKSSIVMGMTWFVLSTGYYMIGFGIKALSGDFFINLLLYSVLAVPMRFAALVIATKVGRKAACALFICLASICSFSVVAIQLLASEEGKSTPTVVMAFGTNMMIEAAWGAAVVLAVELPPTSVRNLSFGFCNGLGRVGSIIAPFLIPRETVPVFGAFLVLGVLQIICFLALLTLQEPKDRPLQDNLLVIKETRSEKETPSLNL